MLCAERLHRLFYQADVVMINVVFPTFATLYFRYDSSISAKCGVWHYCWINKEKQYGKIMEKHCNLYLFFIGKFTCLTV